MAIKRYAPKYVKSYLYKDPSTGEEDEIVFMANGYLFPLFKSYSGVELGKALADYKTGLVEIVNEDAVKVIAEFNKTENTDEQLEIIKNNPTLILDTIKKAEETDSMNGMSLIEYLLIVMRVCALPADQHAEALSVGYELLPQEVYENTTLVFELLNMAMDYESSSKKNSNLRITR